MRRTVNRLWRSFLNFADILVALGVPLDRSDGDGGLRGGYEKTLLGWLL